MASIHSDLTTAEVADILGVTPGRVRQFHVRNQLVGEKVGSMLFFDPDAVKRFKATERAPGRPTEKKSK